MRYVKGEIYFPIIIGVHFVLWAIDLSLLQGSPVLVDGESPVQRVLGEMLSSWVITVIGFNVLMTTRLRWVERIFGGLDKMYVIHRRSGIVGGIGITPFLVLAPTLASDGKKAKLVWSVRAVDDAPFDDELTQLARESDCLDYELWRSNERGYLTIDAAGGAEAFHGKDVFICGPTALRDGLEAQLKKTAASSRRVHSEEFAFR